MPALERTSRRREGRRPDDVVSARRGRRRRPLRPRRRRGACGRRVSRSRSSRPASFRHFGIAYGHGIVGQPAPAAVARAAAAGVPLQLRAGGATGGARRRPRARALAPVGARRARRPGSRSSSSSGAPTSSWRERRRGSAGRSCGGRGSSIVASEFLADAARELGAREVRVVPSGVEIPESVGEPDEPPHVLFVGRLSPEKGIHEFLAATEGLPRVIVGAGPVRRAGGGRLRPARAARRLLRARRGRVRSFPPRGLRRRRARGDGVRPAGRGHARRRARRRDRGWRHRAPRRSGRPPSRTRALARG